MNMREAIEFLDKQAADPSRGLPQELFLFISRLTPLVNIDLLIKDKKGRILLSWRDEPFVGAGWHLPGGIVRFKENLETRLRKVAEKEIGTAVEFDPAPVAINQIVCKSNTRGHFISILYRCFVSAKFTPQNKGLLKNDLGFLMWHNCCPKNLVGVHKKIYRKYIENDDNPYFKGKIGFYKINR
jgi:colanic acid biosynthesis protein WcaH